MLANMMRFRLHMLAKLSPCTRAIATPCLENLGRLVSLKFGGWHQAFCCSFGNCCIFIRLHSRNAASTDDPAVAGVNDGHSTW